MKKKIAVLTATRAEYGLLRNIIMGLVEEGKFDVEVAVTGAHLSAGHGYTYQEIERDGIHIAKKIEILLGSDTPVSISKSMGLALIGFAEYFEESRPDALLVLGDRYETLAVCCAAMNMRIPIMHLYGGETTEGAVDEAIRHSITKIAHLHFTSTEEYRRRVIQLGENPEHVFCVGAIGVENALREGKVTREELGEFTGLDLSHPYGVVTFHPVTLEGDAESQCKEVLDALDYFTRYQFIITGANADCGGNAINKMLSDFTGGRPNMYFIPSLGRKRYLSALKYAAFALGNSSSGLIEAPSFGIPTVNIGDRQKGRLRGRTVVDCRTEAKDIIRAVECSMDEEFRNIARKAENPYGDGHTTEKVIRIMDRFLLNREISLKKKFYDINFKF